MGKLTNDKIVLRPYQTDLISSASKVKGSVLIELPTGAGKSIIAKEIIKRETESGGIVLIVAPKITLLDQLADTFTELLPQIIHGAKDYDSGHNVFVSTLQTAHKRKLGFKPTMIIIDEVHHGFTGKMIKQMLDNFKGKVVGLSATPYDKNGKPLQGFKRHLNRYGIDYMIDNGYLVPIISYRPVKVDLQGIRTTAGDYNQSDLDQKFNNIESVMQIVDTTAQKIHERKQALAFCITIRHAEAMAKAYNDAGIPAAAIHSHQSKDQQAEAMAAFRNGAIKVLTNADMLTTGFDHPPTDTIILARATKSHNLYKQMLGRVLRLSEDKTEAVLLDCAGVIEDLGLPTEPIRPKQDKRGELSKSSCVKCGSDRVYRKIRSSAAYKVCAECGHAEPVESKTGYECEQCGQVHGNDADFEAVDGKLFLLCSCGHKTLISEATSHDELKAIFDKRLIEIIRRRVSAAYCSRLINEFGISFIYSEQVRRQMQALSSFIEHHPEAVTGININTVQLYDGWRLLSEAHEADYLPRVHSEKIVPGGKSQTVKALEAVFYQSRNIDDAFQRLAALLETKGKAPLKDWVIGKTIQQIKESSVQGIEAMTVQRLKNLYNKDKNCNSIDAFVPYIEQERRK